MDFMVHNLSAAGYSHSDEASTSLTKRLLLSILLHYTGDVLNRCAMHFAQVTSDLTARRSGQQAEESQTLCRFLHCRHFSFSFSISFS